MTESGSVSPAVELRGVTKRFGGVVANDNVSLTVEAGEVHAVLGENGAGKTTLMRILYGLTRRDEGEILIGGSPVQIASPKDAIAAGVGMVTQHFSLVETMTVVENLVLGQVHGRLDLDAARRRVEEASARFGIKVSPGTMVSDLSVGERQRVEILKALQRDCRILVLDEPTAVLAPQEVAGLLAAIRRLTREGLAVLFVSHKLVEVLELSDRVTVLRQGRVEGTMARGDADANTLAALMVGRPMMAVDAGEKTQVGAPVLSVRGLSTPVLRDVSFDVRAGEILGVAGVSGNGQTELAAVLSGISGQSAGAVTVDGKSIARVGPAKTMAAGVGRIPEDRHGAVVADLDVATNLALEHLDEFRHGASLDRNRLTANARDLIERYGIKARPSDPVRTLSGGNVQKVLLARVLDRRPKVLIVSQPTRGLDVGATEYVRRRLLEERARGAAILLFSEDLEEILALSDRLMVMYGGAIAGEFDRATADLDRLGLMMVGAA